MPSSSARKTTLVGLARARRRACPPAPARPRCGSRRSRRGRARPWCRPGRRACNRRRRRWGSRSARATAGRSPVICSGSELAEARPAGAGGRGLARLLGVDDAERRRSRRRRRASSGADPQLDARGRRVSGAARRRARRGSGAARRSAPPLIATTRIVAATKPIQSSVSIWSVPGEWGAKARPF